MDNHFSERLKELRIRKNMTQDDLATRLGISRQAISKWERGEGLPDLYKYFPAGGCPRSLGGRFTS